MRHRSVAGPGQWAGAGAHGPGAGRHTATADGTTLPRRRPSSRRRPADSIGRQRSPRWSGLRARADVPVQSDAGADPRSVPGRRARDRATGRCGRDARGHERILRVVPSVDAEPGDAQALRQEPARRNLPYGPPGCGKTFIGRAIAGEMGAQFINVGLSDVLDIHRPVRAQPARAWFQIARRNAPVVIFLDEVDALGQKRSSTRHSAMRGTVNQLLAEPGREVGQQRGGLRRRRDQPAVGRRFRAAPARAIRSDPWCCLPDQEAREAILGYHLKDRPIEGIAPAARPRQPTLPADLAHICESAAERAMMEGIRSGAVRMIRMDDLSAAIGEVRPSTGPWSTPPATSQVRQHRRDLRRVAHLYEAHEEARGRMARNATPDPSERVRTLSLAWPRRGGARCMQPGPHRQPDRHRFAHLVVNRRLPSRAARRRYSVRHDGDLLRPRLRLRASNVGDGPAQCGQGAGGDVGGIHRCCVGTAQLDQPSALLSA